MTDQHFSTKTLLITTLLALLMLATRADHFGSAVNLPDASLAVFFLAGLFTASRLGFAVLCVLAAAIDYWMIEYNGVSAFCITPAYGFLLPTYFVMWWSGTKAARLNLSSTSQWLRLGTMAGLSVCAAFLVSSGSFYLLAPYFSGHSMTEFAQRSVLYFPPYAGVALGYLTVILGLSRLAFGSRTQAAMSGDIRG